MLNRVWFKNHLIQIKQQAGVRYTPELNINLPISEIFDGIGRTLNFYNEIREKHGELIREFCHVNKKYDNSKIQKLYNIIKKEVTSLSETISLIKTYNAIQIPYKKILKKSDKLIRNLWEFIEELEREKGKVAEIRMEQTEPGKYQQSPAEQFGTTIHYVHKTLNLVNFFNKFSTSEKAKLSNRPFLLLTGTAGTGKTHLLCDLVEYRINGFDNTLPAIMTFGELFSTSEDFWKQVIYHLKLKDIVNSKNAFLKLLDDLGKKSKTRSIFIIDALNENLTQNPNYWKNNLNSIYKDINKYPNVAFIISIRNGFENEVLSQKLHSTFINQEHRGFLFKEWEAVTKFFNYFTLPLPEVPLLMPEFQNPLFLLLFCKAFTKRRANSRKQTFRGHEGATYIFENYIDTISRKIEAKFHISHSSRNNLWDTVIEKIAEEMVYVDKDRIPEEKLNNILKQSHPSVNTADLLKELESNLLIIKIPNSSAETVSFDIRFPFQKFSDHLLGRYIFKKYEKEFGKSNKNLKTAKQFFSKRRRFGKFLSESWNKGIIEALSIQCPEQLKGIEFFEVVPYMNKTFQKQLIQESFIVSLIWRNPKSFTVNLENTLSIINKSIIRTKSGHDQLLNAFLSVAPVPNHPFNALRLHNHLIKLSMTVRDSWWSIFLSEAYGSKESVDRLLEWALSQQDKSHINDESIFLSSVALSWFLTTPNRFVRDKATKGLVCLLQYRINLITRLIKFFEKVNDPYVSERLFAVGYGSVLRNQSDIKDLNDLATWVFGKIFSKNKPPLHILLRDYARGILEVAARRCNFKLNENVINPPYRSKWPTRIPSKKALKTKYYKERTDYTETVDRDYLDIWFSVFDGDFSRYVIGTNTWHSEWSGRRIGKSHIDLQKIFNRFKAKLSQKQKLQLQIATNEFYGLKLKEIFEIEFESKDSNDQTIKKKLRKKLLLEFEKTLKSSTKKVFRRHIKPFLDNSGRVNDPLKTFNLRIAQRWIFDRVIKLGYDPKLHGEFDRMVNRFNNSSRTDHKAERIGKKYQWIAYHEFMGLLSDHFEFKGDNWNNSIKIYKGPWHPYIRDIDPSFIPRKESRRESQLNFNNWFNKYLEYDAWGKNLSHKDWLKYTQNIPKIETAIEMKDHEDNNWLMLQGFIEWEEKTPPEQKRFDLPTRQLWYMIRSYIVFKRDLKKIMSWLQKKRISGNRLPESHYFYEAFLGEFPNSTAFNDLRGKYNVWVKPSKDKLNFPAKVTVTDDIYLNEFTLDCSHDGSISMKLPCKWIINKLKLTHNNLDGCFYSKNKELTVVSKSLDENFQSMVLINKRKLLKFLNKSDYTIIWTLKGEKRILNGGHVKNDYQGMLEIDGSYTLNKVDEIFGKIKFKFSE